MERPPKPPAIRLEQMGRTIPLTRGKHAIVDPEDFGWLNKFTWHVAPRGNGSLMAARKSAKKMLIMHREILGIKDKRIFVIHLNDNYLDNRKENLKIATLGQMLACKRKPQGYKQRSRYRQSSYYKGVHKRCKRWVATFRGKHLGTFDTEEEAAKSYDREAISTWAEFAKINFPRKGLKRNGRW